MKKRLPKKLELSRETLRSLTAPRMGEVAGGGSKITCAVMCTSIDTACFQTCDCPPPTSPIVCST